MLGAVATRVGPRCAPLRMSLGEVAVAQAEVLEDKDGIGFLVQLTEDIGAVTTARVSVEAMGGSAIEAAAPFGDADGNFALEVPIVEGRIVFFVAYGALVDPPSRTIMRLLMRDATNVVRGNAAFAFTPAVAEPVVFSSYVRPFVDLAWAVALADGPLDERKHEQVALQLEALLGADDPAIPRFLLLPSEPVDLAMATASLRCRFAELDRQEVLFALLGIAGSDGPIRPEAQAVLGEVAARLGVAEATWHKWAFRMGVELAPAEPETPEPPPPPDDAVVFPTAHRRRIPSVTLPLARPRPRNWFAPWALLAGVLAVTGWFVSILLALTPRTFAAVLIPAAGGLQLLVTLFAVGLGWVGLLAAQERKGAGRELSTVGLALGVTGLAFGGIWWLTLCLGMSLSEYAAP